jgi:nicotinate-nucleotide adenylyltransferase
VLHLEVEPLDISSTGVRQRLAADAPVQDLLPPAVADYIRRHGLYGVRSAL